MTALPRSGLRLQVRASTLGLGLGLGQGPQWGQSGERITRPRLEVGGSPARASRPGGPRTAEVGPPTSDSAHLGPHEGKDQRVMSHSSSPHPLLVLVQLPEREDPAWGSAGRALSPLLGHLGHCTLSLQGHRFGGSTVSRRLK